MVLSRLEVGIQNGDVSWKGLGRMSGRGKYPDKVPCKVYFWEKYTGRCLDLNGGDHENTRGGREAFDDFSLGGGVQLDDAERIAR